MTEWRPSQDRLGWLDIAGVIVAVIALGVVLYVALKWSME